MSKITGNRDGKNGRNETYRVGNERNVSRARAVREVEQGKHPNYHVLKTEKGEKFVRDNPDRSVRDNVNKGR